MTMDIKDFLAPADAAIDVRAPDKARLLQELARRAAAALKLPEAPIAQALAKREEMGSSGTGDGVVFGVWEHSRRLGVFRSAKPRFVWHVVPDSPWKTLYSNSACQQGARLVFCRGGVETPAGHRR